MSAPLTTGLQVRDLHAFYGKSPVLQGVSLSVAPGEILSLLGRNGSGRSTLLKALMGLVPARGEASWQGQVLLGQPTHAIAQLGVGWVPEQREVFPRLTVEQNLLLGCKAPLAADRKTWTVDEMYQLFPALRERRHTAAGVLSGGEQQMLSLSRTLLGHPDLMLVDEPTEGLAPQLVQQVARFLQILRAEGLAVLLVEQKLAIALDIADRCCLMGQGRIVFEGTPAELRQDAALRQAWLEV